MGQIIRFPIIVIDEKANESRFGLTPTLRSSVRPLSSATTTDVVSENGIRVGIDALVFEVSGSNNSSGIPVFNSVSGANIINYHALSGLGTIEVNSDADNVFIDTTQGGITGASVTASVITQRTLNGGIEQEASKINFSDFDATTGVGTSGFPAFHNVNGGDAIGKILFKISEEFDDNSTMFSIGTSANPCGFVEPFAVSGGVTTDTLVEFEYGDFLVDKVTYVEQNISGDTSISTTGNLVADNDILVYKYNGGSNTSGEVQCVIFYDRYLVGVGYHFAGHNRSIAGSVASSESVIFSNMTNHVISNASYSQNFCGTILNPRNNYVYLGGGYGSTELDSIDRYNTNANTFSIITATLTQTKYKAYGGFKDSAGYFFQGRDPAMNDCDKLTYSTEVISSPTTLTYTRLDNTVASNYTVTDSCYICGGSTGSEISNITRFDMTSETDSASINNLTGTRQNMNAKLNSTDCYIFGGKTGASTFLNIIDNFSIADDTTAATQVNSMIADSDQPEVLYDKTMNRMLCCGTSVTLTQPSTDLFKAYEILDCSNDTVATTYRGQKLLNQKNKEGTMEI